MEVQTLTGVSYGSFYHFLFPYLLPGGVQSFVIGFSALPNLAGQRPVWARPFRASLFNGDFYVHSTVSTPFDEKVVAMLKPVVKID